ncbi:MAG TPA: helix-turn-helix domain-containing protein [Thermoleophilaceae bacterium]
MEPVAEPLTHPKREELELPRVLHALSDPVRLQIVSSIANGGECAMGAIDVPVTKSTCTHHFKVLREAGVLQQRQAGTARLNTIRRDDLDARFPGLLDTVLRSADG